MSSSLEIYALGALNINRNGTRLTRFKARKMEALLAYLAYTGQGQSREFLGELLWDDRTQEQSLANLRLLLHRLRQVFDLVTTRRTVILAQPYWIDAREVSTRLLAAEAEWRQTQTFSAETATSIEYALSLYQGDFLAGFYLSDARNFDDWMFFEREQLRLRTINVTNYLVQSYLAQGITWDGIRQAKRLLQLDPFQEATYRYLMRLYMQAGQINEAAAQYETCKRLLAEEFESEPNSETQALYAQIVRNAHRADTVESIELPADLPQPSPVVKPPRSFLAQSTPFVGREREVEALSVLLSDPTQRLITITGLGGMGKTRLALEVAAREADHYPNGVHFIALTALTAPEFVLPTIAEGIEVQVREGLELHQQLLDFLHNKKILLVLDNFEHVLEAAPLVSDMLHAAPDLKILTTSREQLALEGERLFRIGGMDFPTGETSPDAWNYGAVKLFLQSAQRCEPDFVLRSEDLGHLAQICQILGGMPLAIMLAASWVQALSLAEINLEIMRSADFLVNQLRDAPARQRSIRIVFGYSWSLLTDEERRVYAQLSVFRSSFTREAAHEVGGASPRTLKGLVNKSMLNRDTTGRYDIHPLLRFYAAEELDRQPDQAQNVQNAYCLYYANFVAQRSPELFGPHQMGVMSELDSEWVNIQLAWEQAAIHCREHDLCLMTLDMLYYTEVRGIDAQALFRNAIEHLALHPADATLSLALARLALAASAQNARNVDDALSLLKQCIPVLRKHHNSRALAKALHYLGNTSRGREENRQTVIDIYNESIAIFKTLNLPAETSDALYDLAWYLRDQHKPAKQTLNEALKLARQSGAPERIINILALLGRIESIEAHHAQAETLFSEIFTLLPTLDSPNVNAMIWYSWGGVAFAQQDFGEAARRWQTALQLYQDMGYLFTEGVRANLGLADYWQGKFVESRHKLLKVEAVYREEGRPFWLCDMLVNLGWPTIALGRYAEAEGYLREALALGLQTEHVICKLDAIIGFADLLGYAGQPERAIECLAMAISHPHLVDEMKWYAEPILARIKTQAEPALFAEAWQRGQTLNLDSLAVEILREAPLTYPSDPRAD